VQETEIKVTFYISSLKLVSLNPLFALVVYISSIIGVEHIFHKVHYTQTLLIVVVVIHKIKTILRSKYIIEYIIYIFSVSTNIFKNCQLSKDNT